MQLVQSGERLEIASIIACTLDHSNPFFLVCLENLQERQHFQRFFNRTVCAPPRCTLCIGQKQRLSLEGYGTVRGSRVVDVARDQGHYWNLIHLIQYPCCS